MFYLPSPSLHSSPTCQVEHSSTTWPTFRLLTEKSSYDASFRAVWKPVYLWLGSSHFSIFLPCTQTDKGLWSYLCRPQSFNLQPNIKPKPMELHCIRIQLLLLRPHLWVISSPSMRGQCPQNTQDLAATAIATASPARSAATAPSDQCWHHHPKDVPHEIQ